MKQLFLIFTFFLLAKVSLSQGVSFYVQAHQDDWQLFTSANVSADCANNNKLVFITLTAGDAGFGNGGSGKIPYYKAREIGSILSARFLADIFDKPSTIIEKVVTVNDHKIFRSSYNNVVCYFLRLPDGNINGSGFPMTNFKSLEHLYLNKTFQEWATITSVDSSATYVGWDDLKNTVRSIIDLETGNAKAVTINCADVNMYINPGDHSDHTYSGVLALEAVEGLHYVGIKAFVMYISSHLPENRSIDKKLNSSALHACNAITLAENGYPSTWDYQHKLWLLREYWRIIQFPAENQKNQYANTKLINLLGPNTLYSPIIDIVRVQKGATEITTRIEGQDKGSMEVIIYSAKGDIVKRLKKEFTEANDISIPLQKPLSAGTYYLFVKLNSKFQDLKQFVVK